MVRMTIISDSLWSIQSLVFLQVKTKITPTHTEVRKCHWCVFKSCLDNNGGLWHRQKSEIRIMTVIMVSGGNLLLVLVSGWELLRIVKYTVEMTCLKF